MAARRRGYTLTEAMLVVAILGVLATIGPGILLQVNRFFILSRARSDIQREARASMYVINRNLRQAQSSTIVIDCVSGQPYYSRITFTKIQGTTISFYQSGKNLIQSSGNNAKTLSKNLRYLAFAFPRSDDMTIVSVSLTLEESIYQAQTKALHMASERVRIMN